MKEDIFADRYEQLDVIENRKEFLNKIEDLKPYLIEFNEDGMMKDKTYPPDCAVGGEDC